MGRMCRAWSTIGSRKRLGASRAWVESSRFYVTSMSSETPASPSMSDTTTSSAQQLPMESPGVEDQRTT
jgi:hypothetical protein